MITVSTSLSYGSLCAQGIKHHAMKAYGCVDVEIQFLTSALAGAPSMCYVQKHFTNYNNYYTIILSSVTI
jgi:hypothetical protein